MKAYVVARGAPLAPFGEPAAALPIGNVVWGEAQRALLERFGLEVVSVDRVEDVPTGEDRVVTFDDVYFTRRVLKSLLSRWRRAGKPAAQVGLPEDSTFIETFSALQDGLRKDGLALFDLFALPAGQGLEDAAPLAVVYQERRLEVRIPGRIVGTDAWIHPITSSVCLHLRHWVHVLQANRLSIQVRWVDEMVRRPWVGAWFLLKGLWPGRGRYVWRLLSGANLVGRNVDIHPTARVEGCVLGDGVRVGAQALLRGCIVGAGTVVEDRANLVYSVVGENAFVSKYTLVYSSAILAEANVGMSMQMCLAGRRAALTPRATPVDVVPGGRVRVRHEGKLVPVDLPVLGSCYGHDTFVGADVYVGPGRALPNGTRVGPRPERILMSVPDEVDADVFHVVEGGALVPWRG